MDAQIFDFSVLDVPKIRLILANRLKKHDLGISTDMYIRINLARRFLSVMQLHPDWNEEETMLRIRDAFRKTNRIEGKLANDIVVCRWLIENYRDEIALDDIEPGHEYDHYAHHSNEKLTKEQWVAKARAKWGDAYDYTDSVYIAGLKPITIRCIKHDYPFTVQAGNHIQINNKRMRMSGGCPICAQERLAESRRLRHEETLKRRAERERNNPSKPKKPRETPQERFLRRAKAMYPDYDFSQVEYKGREEHVVIICPKHGQFKITPRILLMGEKGKKPHGCYQCCGLTPLEERKFTVDMFKAKMQEIYGDKYTFVWSDFKNKKSQIRFHCPDHGEQKRSAKVLLEGKGCEYCNGKFYSPDWIKNARKVHGDKYEYDATRPPRIASDYIYYKCPEHGWQRARYDSHVTQGHGCKWCAGVYISVSVEERKANWVARCQKKYNDRFDYSQFEYVNNDTKGIIICREHNCAYEQDPWSHLRHAGGCPVCNGSEGEVHIRTWLENHNIKFIPQYQIPNENIFCKRQYLVPDFWVPDYNLFIEMNGRQHYMYIAHFHNDREHWTFEDQQIRDETLRAYCKEHKHNLLEIKYDQMKQIPKILERAIKKYAPKQ